MTPLRQSIRLLGWRRGLNVTQLLVTGIPDVESLILHGIRLPPQHIVDYFLALTLPYAIGTGHSLEVPVHLSAASREYWEAVAVRYRQAVQEVFGCSELQSGMLLEDPRTSNAAVAPEQWEPLYEDAIFLTLGKESLLSDHLTGRRAQPVYIDIDFRTTFATPRPLDVLESYASPRRVFVIGLNVPYPHENEWELGGVRVQREAMLGFLRGIGLICCFVGRSLARRVLLGCEAEVWVPSEGKYYSEEGCDYSQTKEFASDTTWYAGCVIESPVSHIPIVDILQRLFDLNLCEWLRSCTLARGRRRWCYECEKCLSIFLMSNLRRLDLSRIHFDPTALEQSKVFTDFKRQLAAGRLLKSFYT